ncbi:MAG: hypothetical protein C0490_12225 [Marivirga sp.]|nr:hypothetical protein [Marivirga sp.]
MLGIREIAKAKGSYSVRDLQLRYKATSVRHLLAAYAIQKKYTQLGEVFSPLGLPIDHDLEAEMNITTNAVPLGGYQAQFRGGDITIKDFDNIAVEEVKEKVKIWLVGLECQIRQETEDEIFGTIGIILPSKPMFTHAIHFPTGSEYLAMGRDGARTVELNVLLYDDVPADVVLTCNLVEHDSGDISEYKRRIAEALSKAAEAGLGSVGVPSEAIAANHGWVGAITVGLVNVLSGWLGADDDAFLPHGFRIPAKDILVDLRIKNGKIKNATSPFQTRTMERPDTPGVVLHYNVPPVIVSGTDQGSDLGRYAFYFKVEPYSIETDL